MLNSLPTIRVILLTGLLLAGSAQAERYARSTGGGTRSGPKPWRWLLQLSGEFAYSQSDPDYIDQATYQQKFGTAGVGGVALGFMVSERFYLGVRYEYWYAQRRMASVSGQTNDSLNYHGGGAELGYRGGSPRVFWMFSGSFFYPLSVSVHSTLAGAGTYEPDVIPFAFQGRFTLGLRLSGTFTLLFAGGFRYADLGALTGPSGSFVGGTGTVNLSGPFGGLGLGLTF